MSHRSRRTHILLLLVAIALIYLLFFSTESTGPHGLRHSPLRGDLSDEDLQLLTNAKLSQILEKASDVDGDGVAVPNDAGKSLDTAADATKEADGRAGGSSSGRGSSSSSSNADDSSLEFEDIPIAGRRTMPRVKDGPPKQAPQAPQAKSDTSKESREQQPQALKDTSKPKYPKAGSDAAAAADDAPAAASPGKADDLLAAGGSSRDPGEVAARDELQAILKRAPIVIFSKTYCPYSKRAKDILLHDYDIVPKPYVVELDLLTDPLPVADDADADTDTGPAGANDKASKTTKSNAKERASAEDADSVTMGKKIQDMLKSLTGRSTVPNIMISSESVGGSDEIIELHKQGKLADKIRKLGGKRIVSVEPSATLGGPAAGAAAAAAEKDKKNKKDGKAGTKQ